MIGDPLISVEALIALRDLLNALPTDAGKCDNPVLNTFRTGDTHESSGKPAPAAKSETGRSIADHGGQREKRGTAPGDYRSAPGGNRDGRMRGADAT